MRFLRILCLLPVAASANASLPPPVKLSFEDLPALVRDRNDHAKAAEADAEAARTRTGHLLRSYLPEVKAEAGAEAFKPGDRPSRSQPFGGVSAELNLFRGGRDRLDGKIRDARALAARAGADSVRAHELTKARNLFWKIVFQREIEGVIQESLTRNADSLASARRRLSAGMGSETDRIEFEIRKTNLEQDLARVRLEQNKSQRSLNVLLGFPSETVLDAGSSIPHDHQDSVLKETIGADQHWEIRSGIALTEIAGLAAREKALQWAPSLTLFGSYGLYTQREREHPDAKDRLEAAAGAKLTFHLFDGGTSLNESRALAGEREALELKTRQSRRELAALFEGEKEELALLHDLIHGAETNVELARAYLKGSLSEYSRGLKNSPDVLGANQRYLDALLRSAELRRDYQLARTELLEHLEK